MARRRGAHVASASDDDCKVAETTPSADAVCPTVPPREVAVGRHPLPPLESPNLWVRVWVGTLVECLPDCSSNVSDCRVGGAR